MKLQPLAFFLVFTVLPHAFLVSPAYAEDVFEVTIQFASDRGYYGTLYEKPPKNIIKVRDGSYVRPFKVVLKNISSRTQSLKVDQEHQGLGLISFEITDERGNNNVVTKKLDPMKSKSEGYNYMRPGEAKEFEVNLNALEWNNAYKLMNGGATKLHARASYKNGSTVIYSDYYKIVLEE